MSTHPYVKKQITISLDSFITLVLGPEQRGSRELPSLDIALIVDVLVRKDLLFKVQFTEWSGEPLERPLLWSYNDWYESSTNYKKQKEDSDRRRDEYHIFQANLKIIKEALETDFLYPPDSASAYAYHLLKTKAWGKVWAVIGVDQKIIKKVEEIP